MTKLWNTFSSAPHRLFFFSGAIQLILPILFWSIELLGRYTDIWNPLNTVVPSTWAHGFIMIYGLFIFFIFGFLMTVFPRWMKHKDINYEQYVSPFILLNAGLFIFEIGLFFSRQTMLSGIGVFLFGWCYGITILYNTLKNAPAKNKNYESILLASLTAGAAGIVCYGWWVYSDNWFFIDLALNIGLWLYLIPALFTVSHRMLPFFSSNIIENYSLFQPRQTLWLFLLGCITHFALISFNRHEWLFFVDIPLASIALLHSIRWQLINSFKDRLLGILHMAFFWLFIGLSLYSVQSLLLFFNGEYILGLAPLHAITIGFFTSLLIAMASRVTMGHSGRMLILDKLTWTLFLGLQVAAIIRVLADIQFDNNDVSNHLNLLSSGIWLFCLSIWFVKFAPMYLSARVDGKKG